MARLNGIYLFVIDESISGSIEVTEHPVESGIDISDHTKRKPLELALSGEIVGVNAASIVSRIVAMQQSGTLCSYSGRTSLAGCVITQFSRTYTNGIFGGCKFSMTLREIRTASTSYKKPKKKKPTKKTGTQQVVKTSNVTYVYHTVKQGDTVWALVAADSAPYKQYGLSCEDVMRMNQDAFSRKGDFTTLQVGQKIIVGKR